MGQIKHHKKQSREDKLVDLASQESMPTSDAPGWTLGTKPVDLTEKQQNNPIVRVLSGEHAIIHRMMDVIRVLIHKLEHNESIEKIDLSTIQAFLREYVDDLHHRKEEFLFPYLRAKNKNISAYLFTDLHKEHDHSHRLHKHLASFLKLSDENKRLAKLDLIIILKDMLALSENHVAKEEEYIFPLISEMIDEDTKKIIMGEYKKIDSELGERKHEYFVHLTEQLWHQLV